MGYAINPRAGHEEDGAGAFAGDGARDFDPDVGFAVDQDVALLWGELSAVDRNLPVPDGLIAATAIRHGFGVVTRNTKDFRATGVILIYPWQGSE